MQFAVIVRPWALTRGFMWVGWWLTRCRFVALCRPDVRMVAVVDDRCCDGQLADIWALLDRETMTTGVTSLLCNHQQLD